MRRSILKEMQGEEEISPRELSHRMEISLSKLSYHVRVLVECEAITLVRTQPVRGSMQHFYRFAIQTAWPYGILGLQPPPPAGD
jgi:DNA-binding transcriptional ArsR family regulator